VARSCAATDNDVTEVNFDVTIRGKNLGRIALKIDHAQHRGQGPRRNSPTVLAWEPQINAILKASSHIDDWVLLERNENGDFKLTIQREKPSWAP
jgi:hypothetical protein